MEPIEPITKAIAATPVSTSSKYVRVFESSFVPIKKEQLRDKARSGNLRHCQFRSLCWRFFLHCLPEQYDQWLDTCTKSRRRYEEIRSKHLAAKKQLDSNDHHHPQQQQQQQDKVQSSLPSGLASNLHSKEEVEEEEEAKEAKPISGIKRQQQQRRVEQQSSSPEIVAKNKELEDEQQYLKAAEHCDHKNVLRTIERDVVRTFPDMEFFRQTEMQSILENVLFNYASEHPHISYKQGMHELLATLLYVLHTDSQNCLINYEGGYANETIATLLDLNYLEHDVYQLFCNLMKSIETWYQNDEILVVPDSSSTKIQRESGEILINRSNRPQQVGSVLGIKLKRISENIVKNYDLELFNHLEALQIAPQIYGIRWMRLLFGREFEFLDLLTVWDAIICDQVSMSLTDYVFASMLITIREELVNGDFTDCLNNLMRHQFKDVQYVIKLALYLRDPQNNARPKPIQSGVTVKHYSQAASTQRSNRYSPETSLTSKLSQQYISVKNQIQEVNRNRHVSPSIKNQLANSTRRYTPKTIAPTNIDNRESRKIFSMTSKPPPLLITNTIKEYEMREMQSTSSSSTVPVQQGYQASKYPLGTIGGGGSGSRNALNVSTESYDDLHSIVDYCWRLLSEQIDSLQRCLPKEKSLHSEDEIFVALAQLKKVRDVLKGSLRLEDELESKPERSK